MLAFANKNNILIPQGEKMPRETYEQIFERTEVPFVLRTPGNFFFDQAPEGTKEAGVEYAIPSQILIGNDPVPYDLWDDGTAISLAAEITEPEEIGGRVIIGPEAVVEQGAFVGFGSIVCPKAQVKCGASLGSANIVLPESSVEEFAVTAPNVQIGEGARVGRHSTIASGTVIEDGVSISQYSEVGPNNHIGEGAVLRMSTGTGDNVTILPGAIIRGRVKSNTTVYPHDAPALRTKRGQKAA